MPTELINLWNEIYNGLKEIQPLLIPLSVLIGIIVLLFGNNLLNLISVKFGTYSGGMIYRHGMYKTYPTFYVFMIPLEITSNNETEIIKADLKYRSRRGKDNKLHHSVNGEIDPYLSRHFSVPVKKNIVSRENFVFVFGGNFSKKHYKEIEEFYQKRGNENKFGIDCYLRLYYRKNNKAKKTIYRKFSFSPLNNYVWLGNGRTEHVEVVEGMHEQV